MPQLHWWAELSRSTTVTTPPTVQVAGDGRWETAAVVPSASGRDDARVVVQKVAHGAQEDLAVEVLWPGQAFAGVRWPAGEVQQAAAATARAYAVFSQMHEQPIEAGILALLGTRPGPDLELAELGAVNAWRSVGSLVLWRRGDDLTAEALHSRVARRPDLTTCSHPVAVELAAILPRPLWIGIVVSVGSGSVHHLDQHALGRVLAGVI